MSHEDHKCGVCHAKILSGAPYITIEQTRKTLFSETYKKLDMCSECQMREFVL